MHIPKSIKRTAMRKILCPTNFSEPAQTVIAYAAKLAQAHGCDLTLLNVQSIFDYSPVELVQGKRHLEANMMQRLEALALEVSRVFKISCDADMETRFKPLSSTISEKGNYYDMVVMGTDGPDDLYQFLAGSNTYNTIVKSKTPVLVIPNDYVYSPIKNIVYAFDYLHRKKLPMTQLLKFTKMVRCDLTLLQVMEETYDKSDESELKELQSLISNAYRGEFRPHYATIRSSDAAEAINSFTLRNQPDMLALCSVHRNFISKAFHKSVIKHITTIADYPVLVFHQ